MSEKQSIWSKADSFLTTTRKIIVNSLTALILVIITFSLLAGIGSMFSGFNVKGEPKAVDYPMQTVIDAVKVI